VGRQSRNGLKGFVPVARHAAFDARILHQSAAHHHADGQVVIGKQNLGFAIDFTGHRHTEVRLSHLGRRGDGRLDEAARATAWLSRIRASSGCQPSMSRSAGARQHAGVEIQQLTADSDQHQRLAQLRHGERMEPVRPQGGGADVHHHQMQEAMAAAGRSPASNQPRPGAGALERPAERVPLLHPLMPTRATLLPLRAASTAAGTGPIAASGRLHEADHQVGKRIAQQPGSGGSVPGTVSRRRPPESPAPDSPTHGRLPPRRGSCVWNLGTSSLRSRLSSNCRHCCTPSFQETAAHAFELRWGRE
jgi:hypothetical protein